MCRLTAQPGWLGSTHQLVEIIWLAAAAAAAAAAAPTITPVPAVAGLVAVVLVGNWRLALLEQLHDQLHHGVLGRVVILCLRDRVRAARDRSTHQARISANATSQPWPIAALLELELRRRAALWCCSDAGVAVPFDRTSRRRPSPASAAPRASSAPAPTTTSLQTDEQNRRRKQCDRPA